jgi:hypothetical protein
MLNADNLIRKYSFWCWLPMWLTCCNIDSSNVDATGSFDEVLVLADESKWNSHFKDVVYRELEVPYDVLPQPEKSLVVTYIPFEKFERIFKRYRNILVIADLEDHSPVTQLAIEHLGEELTAKALNNPDFFIGKKNNLWANNQLVVFLFAPGLTRIDSILSQKGDFIRNIFLQNELNRYHSAVMAFKENKQIMKTIREKFGFSMDIPSDYFIAKNEHNFLWIRKETEEVSFNIMIFAEDMTGNLPESRGIELRNLLGKTHVSSEIPGSYMITDSILPPEFQVKKQHGITVYETRGLWRLENDFMGGPFVTYYFENPSMKKAFVIDAFIHAPGTKKKPQLRRLEALLTTVRF